LGSLSPAIALATAVYRLRLRLRLRSSKLIFSALSLTSTLEVCARFEPGFRQKWDVFIIFSLPFRLQEVLIISPKKFV